MNLASRVKLNQGRFGPQIKCTTSQKTAKGERGEAKEKSETPSQKPRAVFLCLQIRLLFVFFLLYSIPFIQTTQWSAINISPVQVKNSISVYIDRDSVRDRDKNNREKNYIDRVREAK